MPEKEKIPHDPTLEALMAGIDEVHKGLGPVYDGIREELMDRQFARHVEVVSIAESEAAEAASWAHEKQQNAADYNLLTGFGKLLPELTLPETFSFADGTRCAFVVDDLYTAKLVQAKTVWFTKPAEEATPSGPGRLKVKQFPGFVLGQRAHFTPGEGRNTFIDLIVLSAAAPKHLNGEAQHEPELFRIITKENNIAAVTALQKQLLASAFSDKEIRALEYRHIYSSPVRYKVNPEAVSCPMLPKRVFAAIMNRAEAVGSANFDIGSIEGLERNLLDLAVAFGKTEELKKLIKHRDALETPDPLAEYIGTGDEQPDTSS